MKKIVLSVLFVFIGFGYANAETAAVSPELAAARAKYDTPFTKKYRPRYEANDINLVIVLGIIDSECAKKCSKQDNISIQKLADAGDMFSLAILPSIVPDNLFMTKQKESADKGEPFNANLYGLMNLSSYELSEKYFLKMAHENYFNGYIGLRTLYGRAGKTSKFCAITKEGYNKFGFEFLSGYFLHDSKSSEYFFNTCTADKKEAILSKMGNEGKLVQGYLYVKNGEYDKAYNVFQNLYKPGDGSKISANAGYCLGMMNYYGKGIGKNLEKGRQLLTEAYDNGVFHPFTPEQTSMPAKLEIITYYGYVCSQLNHKEG